MISELLYANFLKLVRGSLIGWQLDGWTIRHGRWGREGGWGTQVKRVIQWSEESDISPPPAPLVQDLSGISLLHVRGKTPYASAISPAKLWWIFRPFPWKTREVAEGVQVETELPPFGKLDFENLVMAAYVLWCDLERWRLAGRAHQGWDQGWL